MRPYVLLALVALPLLGMAQEGLPDDEQGLFAYATARANRPQWALAERAFLECLKRFPDGRLAEQVHFELGRLHVYHSRRFDEGRKWLEELCRRYPEGTWRWPARFLIAQSWRQQGKTLEAIAEYRRILEECDDPAQAAQAGDELLAAKEKYFQPSVPKTFLEGEKAFVDFHVRNVDEAELRLFRVPSDEVLERIRPEQPSLQDALFRVDAARRAPVKEWKEFFRQPRGNWSRKKVDLPELGRGFYLLLATHDGITKGVAAVVNRYGLVTKSDAERLLVFAQDRTTGEPAADLAVRVLRAGGVREGRTDASGLWAGERAQDDALVLGMKEGDTVLAGAWSQGWTGRESIWHFVTDRPIYRPGQKVQWKLLHRVKEGAKLGAREGLRVRVVISDPRGNRVHEGDHALNRFGTCAGDFPLGEEPPLGVYQLTAEPLEAVADAQRWWESVGRFRVDEYRKPEYEVKVAFDRERYVQGDTLVATIGADYYFGSPVPDAAVRWRILRAPHWPGWGPRAFWMDWYGEEPSLHGGGEEVQSGSGVTDPDGRLRVSFPVPRWEKDARYTVVADVTDLSRREVAGSATVLATRAEFGLGIEVDRYLYRPDEKIEARLQARFHDGRPAAGVELRITAAVRTWHDGTHVDEGFRMATLPTDASGEALAIVPAGHEGSVVLRVEARDARGNAVDAERWIWVTSDDWDGGTVSWDGVDVVADRASYRPGDKARFLLSSQEEDLPLLFTIEGDRILDHRVVRLSGHTATVEVEVTEAMVPNAFAAVASVRGDVVYQQQRSIVVDPGGRFLTVEIRPDRAQYGPRDPAIVEVTTRDRDGNPVAAEVALGIADESIYAIQPEYAPDIRKAFVPQAWNRVTTGSSLQFGDWGGLYAEDFEIGAGMVAEAEEAPRGARLAAKDEAGGEELVEAHVRRQFADTMLWSPAVVTGADGKATVRIDAVADNLTTWRLTARAVSAEGRVGQQKETVVVRKDLIVRLAAPRFFTQGDATTLTAIVRNDLDNPKRVQVEIAAEGLELAGETVIQAEVGAQEEQRFDWPATVPRAGTARITVKALTNEVSDAMQLDVPVLPHGSLQWTSRAGIVKDDVTETFEVPEGAIHEATELLVVVSPTHAATVLDALDWLADYPYGCVEQTMSRFLPSVITAQVLRRLDIRKPWLEEQLPEMIRAGLQRLTDFQHEDGGWGWWQNDESNPFLTAYVVYGLALARGAGVPVSDAVLARGVAALRARLAKAEDAEERVYLRYALSAAGEKAGGGGDEDLALLPPACKAMVALALAKDGERTEAKRVLQALAAGAVDAGGTARWPASGEYRWMGDATEATAVALQAFLAIEPNHPLVEKTVAGLALSREGDHWVSTRQTALVVLAMSEYLALTGERTPDLTLALELNGEAVWERRVTKENWHEFDGATRFDASKVRPGANTVTVRRKGEGSPVYSIFLKQFRKADRFEASKGGLTVDRAYSLVRTEGKERKLVPLAAGATVASGDEIEVKLTVRADRPYTYLMLEDPLPSGFEPEREPRRSPWEGWTWWFANKAYRDEKVEIAIPRLPQGEQSVTYVMRAETPGTVRVLPAAVWSMYRPGEGANSAGFTVVTTAQGGR